MGNNLIVECKFNMENAFTPPPPLPPSCPTTTLVLSLTHDCKQMGYLVTVHLLLQRCQ